MKIVYSDSESEIVIDTNNIQFFKCNGSTYEFDQEMKEIIISNLYIIEGYDFIPEYHNDDTPLTFLRRKQRARVNFILEISYEFADLLLTLINDAYHLLTGNIKTVIN